MSSFEISSLSLLMHFAYLFVPENLSNYLPVTLFEHPFKMTSSSSSPDINTSSTLNVTVEAGIIDGARIRIYDGHVYIMVDGKGDATFAIEDGLRLTFNIPAQSSATRTRQRGENSNETIWPRLTELENGAVADFEVDRIVAGCEPEVAAALGFKRKRSDSVPSQVSPVDNTLLAINNGIVQAAIQTQSR